MTDHNAIQLISDLLLSNDAAMNMELTPFAKLAQKYPYFVPIRYIKAKEQHQSAAFSNEMLTTVYPYIGNWLLFSDYLQGIRFEERISSPYPEITEEEYIPPAYTSEPVAIEEEPAYHFETFTTYAADNNEQIEESTLAEVIIEIDEPQPEDPIFSPVYTEDYFLQQGIKISADMPDSIDDLTADETDAKDKALMVMMSFKDWLLHFKNSSDKEKEEQEDKRAVKTMWQKEKLAAALQEENEEIPENVFEMAVNSITSEDGLASESLAEIYCKQQKYDIAIEMYHKLSLRNPEKNAYFAQKIKDILKNKEL